jgi:hypothetical protein
MHVIIYLEVIVQSASGTQRVTRKWQVEGSSIKLHHCDLEGMLCFGRAAAIGLLCVRVKKLGGWYRQK